VYLEDFFTALLVHAASENEKLRNEAAALLAGCLERDPSTFALWLELYPKHISESNSLMIFLFRNWDKDFSKKISPANLVKLAQDFINTNKQIKAGTFIDKKTKNAHKKPSSAEAKELDVCTSTCDAIQKKLQPFAVKEAQAKNNSGNSGVLFLLVVVVGVGAAAYTATNCCSLPWCHSVDLLKDLLKC